MESSRPYVWDEDKRDILRHHKIDFTAAHHFEWETVFLFVDDREDYGELREVAIGFIGPGLYVLTYTSRGKQTRIISLRKAEKSDVRKYVKGSR